VSVASELFRVRREYDRHETDLLRAVHAILGEPEDLLQWKLYFDLDRCDEADWDGICLDLTDATPGIVFTPEQQEQVWALGFTVIRINYRDSTSVSGDWWKVKGRPDRTCGCPKYPAASA
jgi:hypothetical protein